MGGDGHFNIPSQKRNRLPIEPRKGAGEFSIGDINSVTNIRIIEHGIKYEIEYRTKYTIEYRKVFRIEYRKEYRIRTWNII